MCVYGLDVKNKAVIICRQDNCVYVKSKRIYTLLELSEVSKVSG